MSLPSSYIYSHQIVMNEAEILFTLHFPQSVKYHAHQIPACYIFFFTEISESFSYKIT